ncbi:hypothetical protein C4D60_Mb06t01530 [Musa balbisiana]|uniref:Uncharacterized protein n=1 Tax=Musa balbisiana TaxID=52838 RepID=A0A4S8IJT1_MUSBA|nr:hypothetical protein C4D60_Mb06t01530 [Musa balbisiana]
MVFIAGKLMANMLPNKVIRMPYTNWSFSLNPGPFNLKEHVVTAMLAGTASASAGFEILTMSKVFYHKDIPLLPAMLLVLSVQVACLSLTLHEPEKRVKGKLSRYQFFIIVIVVIFTYSIVPVYLFPSVTALSFVCWIWKDSITAQQIGSGFNGLGIGSFALDWITMSSYLDSPLAVPAFVVVNMMAGFILILYVLIPLSYWNNAYDAKRFPIFSSSIFDIDGQFYNVSRVLDEKSLTFNEEAYNSYSKLYFSASLIYSYGFTIASFTSSISHVALFYGRSLWLQFVNSYQCQMQDVHTRLMKQNYESIPRWWFYSLLFSMIGFAILVCEIFSDQLQLRYWGVVLACALVFIFLLPEGVMMATTSSEFSIKLLLEILIGYLQSGKPIANIAFTTYGSTAINTAKYFTMDMKRAYYMKIPPKVMFFIQILGNILACVVSFSVGWWTLQSVKNICYPELLPKGSPWTCPWERRSFAIGVTWGVIGPIRMFYPHGTYSIIFIFIIIGLLAPVGVWMLSRVYPQKTWIKLINWPVIFSVGTIVPPGTPVNVWSWFITGLIFNYFVFRRFKGWWARYNYVLSAGLDSGATFLTIIVTLFLQFRGIYGPDWWGLEMDDHCPLAHCPTAPGVIVKGCPVIN